MLSVAKMDASFHFMRWSLVQECLATADFYYLTNFFALERSVKIII